MLSNSELYKHHPLASNQANSNWSVKNVIIGFCQFRSALNPSYIQVVVDEDSSIEHHELWTLQTYTNQNVSRTKTVTWRYFAFLLYKHGRKQVVWPRNFAGLLQALIQLFFLNHICLSSVCSDAKRIISLYHLSYLWWIVLVNFIIYFFEHLGCLFSIMSCHEVFLLFETSMSRVLMNSGRNAI